MGGVVLFHGQLIPYPDRNGISHTGCGAKRTDLVLSSFKKYTGQLENDAGLYFYNSRYYDSYLNRFLSPDDIIPDPYNPLDYDRYAYVRNNPVHWT